MPLCRLSCGLNANQFPSPVSQCSICGSEPTFQSCGPDCEPLRKAATKSGEVAKVVNSGSVRGSAWLGGRGLAKAPMRPFSHSFRLLGLDLPLQPRPAPGNPSIARPMFRWPSAVSLHFSPAVTFERKKKRKTKVRRKERNTLA